MGNLKYFWLQGSPQDAGSCADDAEGADDSNLAKADTVPALVSWCRLSGDTRLGGRIQRELDFVSVFCLLALALLLSLSFNL